MDIHQNARTCPASRRLLVQRIERDGWSATEAAEAAGVSVRTAYKWLRRFRSEGEEGLTDRSSRPHRCPRRTKSRVVRQIIRLRRRKMVAAEIACRLGLPRSTVAAVLQREGMSRLRHLESREPVQRYQWERPGELIHLDIKKLGRFKRHGHRVTGNKRKRSRGAGWDYVHVCVDDASRLAYVEVLSDERKETAVAFLHRAASWFNSIGVNVKRVMTDNGSCYVSKLFRSTCKRLGMKHIRTKPYTPRTNGKAERFIQTLLREWAYRFSYTSSIQRTARLPTYLHFYNHHRQHGSLNSMPPISRLRSVNNVPGLHS